MRRMTHYLAGCAVGCAFAPDPLSFAAAVAGAGLPDKLDSLFSFGDHERWAMIHRTWSHNVAYWLVPLVVWSFFFTSGLSFPWNIVSGMAGFFLLGVASHLLLDFFTPMGVGICPFASANSRVSLRLVKTNSVIDTMLGPSLLALGIIFRWRSGFDAGGFFGALLAMGAKYGQ